MAPDMACATTSKDTWSRNGERGEAPHERLFPDDVYATADGFIALSAYTDIAWKALCDVLARPVWQSDALLTTPEKRMAERGRIEPELVGLLRAQPSAHWLSTFERAGVPSAPIVRVADVVNDPTLLARGMMYRLDHPVAGPLEVLGNPVKRIDQTYRSVDNPAPRHGQHTRSVLSQDLGYSASEIDRLIAEGAIADLSPEPT